MGGKNNIELIKGKYRCLIHLDRLSLTLNHHSGSGFKNIRNPDLIPEEQRFKNILLIYNRFKGINDYFHCYGIYYKGVFVGYLYSGRRGKKYELQLDFDKQLFYSYSFTYWYEVYQAILSELELTYNNIRYLEISIDTNKNILGQFRDLFIYCENNEMTSHYRFKLRKGTIVHTLNNGRSFLVGGTDNEIAIYRKSDFMEEFIAEYFKNNGFSDIPVYRIESRLNWDYLRNHRNKGNLDIKPETLLNPGQLASLFILSTKAKTTFKDTTKKKTTSSRNTEYEKVNVIDDLSLDFTELPVLNSQHQNNHYKTHSVDISILRLNFYQYVDTGADQYLGNIKLSAIAAGMKKEDICSHLRDFIKNYKGNRSPEKLIRMRKALHKYSAKTNYIGLIINKIFRL